MPTTTKNDLKGLKELSFGVWIQSDRYRSASRTLVGAFRSGVKAEIFAYALSSVEGSVIVFDDNVHDKRALLDGKEIDL